MEFKLLYWYWLVFGMVLIIAEFMPIRLDGGATGISYVLMPDKNMKEYNRLQLR